MLSSVSKPYLSLSPALIHLWKVLRVKRIHTSSQSLYSNQSQEKLKANLQECCSVLELEINCSETELRAAYLMKVKDHHPDRQKDKGDSTMFNKIQNAYQTLLDHRNSQSTFEDNEMAGEYEDEEDILRHTAPQHRQYLTFEGIGSGTPGQRKRQYEQFKVSRANERVYEHRKAKFGINESAVISKDRAHAKKIISGNLIHRLVDDMVREAMQKGDFDNLAGTGKPINYTDHNPFLDTTTHNLNKILVNNGFTPEWILLSKEIRTEISEARQNLAIIREQLGPPPYSEVDTIRWDFHEEKYISTVQNINTKINKFNFIVPFMEKQMVHYNANLSVKKILDNHVPYLPTDEDGKPIKVDKLPLFPQKQPDDKIHWGEVWSNIKDVFRYR